MIEKIRNAVDKIFNKLHLLKYKELILYLFIGGGTTVVDWVLYTLFVLFIPPINLERVNQISPNIIAYCFSWAGAVLFAYIFSRLFVFESNNNIASEFVKFVLSRFLTLVISILGDMLLCGKLAVIPIGNPFIAKAVISVMVIIINYITSKLLVFKK